MLQVLIVEDEAGIRNSLANAFFWEEMGCELFSTAESGMEAVEICIKHQVDIIISDIVMPGIDGITFLKFVRDRFPDICFVILTGHRNFDYIRDALNLGAYSFLLKPVNLEELKDVIKKLAEVIQKKNGLVRQPGWLSHKSCNFSPCRLQNCGFLKEFVRKLRFPNNSNSVSIGISSICHGYGEVKEGYVQALCALGQKFFSGNRSINVYRSDDNKFSNKFVQNMNNFISFQKKFADIVLQKENLETDRAAFVFFDDFISFFSQDIDLIRSSFIIFAVLCIQNTIGKDGRHLEVVLEKYSNFRKVINCGNIETLRDIFVNLVDDLADRVSLKGGNRQSLISKVLLFIEENYQHSISLVNVAKKVYLSPAYLSSLITRETGKSFTDFLSEIRIKHAVDMLRDKNLKITDIAYKVGFKEPQYFTSTFKKLMNITPRDYREMYLKDT